MDSHRRKSDSETRGLVAKLYDRIERIMGRRPHRWGNLQDWIDREQDEQKNTADPSRSDTRRRKPK